MSEDAKQTVQFKDKQDVNDREIRQLEFNR